MQTPQGTFLSGPNASFIAELYGRYVENPTSVDPSWQTFFAELQDEGRAVLQDLQGASWAPRTGERPIERRQWPWPCQYRQRQRAMACRW